jgi:hypothetical protein
MSPKEYMQQAVKSGHTIFNNTYDMAVLFQDQYEKAASTLLEQANWLSEEQQKVINSYVDAYKSGRNHFKKYADDSYKQFENLFQ